MVKAVSEDVVKGLSEDVRVVELVADFSALVILVMREALRIVHDGDFTLRCLADFESDLKKSSVLHDHHELPLIELVLFDGLFIES